MDKKTTQAALKQKHWLEPGHLKLDTFLEQIAQVTRLEDWPYAQSVEQNALVYSADELHKILGVKANAQPCNPGSPHYKSSLADWSSGLDKDVALELMAEWTEVFLNGPGIIVIKGAFVDTFDIGAGNERTTATIDVATGIFERLIENEREAGMGGGDHFAKPGANDRIWNSLEKHCVADPDNYLAYYSNPLLALVSRAWLGPGYQVTAQVNRVNPGGAQQMGHRDYHLGFMTSEEAARFPAHIHELSPRLTLQGAIAHCDMPLESGPTLYLPYSQQAPSGYIDFVTPDFQNLFNERRSQFAMQKGDAVFFNPALMHAAGHNQTQDVFRLANLLQVSSPFGRAIEAVDRLKMLETLYPRMLEISHGNYGGGASSAKSFGTAELSAVMAASAEGYSFPTNLDTDTASGGLAPLSQAGILLDCLQNQVAVDDAIGKLAAHQERTQPRS